jgi:hypothetical protein
MSFYILICPIFQYKRCSIVNHFPFSQWFIISLIHQVVLTNYSYYNKLYSYHFPIIDPYYSVTQGTYHLIIFISRAIDIYLLDIYSITSGDSIGVYLFPNCFLGCKFVFVYFLWIKCHQIKLLFYCHSLFQLVQHLKNKFVEKAISLKFYTI